MTTVRRDRRRLFSSFEVGCVAARAMTDPRTWDDASLLAWVLMPDHWHGLIVLGGRRSLSQVMQRLKANSARAIATARICPATVWQAGFHDHAIRGDRNLEAAARYLLANPLRAGPAESVGTYPFWDSVWSAEDLVM